jgi:hypothetical protein
MNFLIIALFAVLATFAAAGTLQRDGLNETLAGNCGGNCPGNDCSSCPCGSSSNYVDIASWCSKHTWNQVKLNSAVSICIFNFYILIFSLGKLQMHYQSRIRRKC